MSDDGLGTPRPQRAWETFDQRVKMHHRRELELVDAEKAIDDAERAAREAQLLVEARKRDRDEANQRLRAAGDAVRDAASELGAAISSVVAHVNCNAPPAEVTATLPASIPGEPV